MRCAIWALVSVLCVASVLAAAAAGGGWSVTPTHRDAWERARAALTVEAARNAPTDNEADVELGRMPADDVTTLFHTFFSAVEHEQWTHLDALTTPEVQFTDLATGVTCRGRADVTECLQRDVAAKYARCAAAGCTGASYQTDLMHTDGPTVVARVTETLRTADGLVQRRLFVYFVIFRPPLERPEALLVHSAIAVIERLDITLSATYAAPTELAEQHAVIDVFATRHEAHWRGAHERAVAEEAEALVRQQRYGTVAPERWSKRARAWCARRAALGEPTGEVDCGAHRK